MFVKPEDLGAYKINLGDADLESRLVFASFRTELDTYASFTLHVAKTAVEISACGIADFPSQAEFTWKGRCLFRGHILRAELTNYSRICLTYVDGLFLPSKNFSNQFVKQQSLQDCLQKLSAPSELTPDFRGSFAELLAGFSQGESSSLDLISSLALKHGFHFAPRSGSSQVVFLKPGESATSVTLDASREAAAVRATQSAEASTQNVLVRYFDAKSSQPKDTSLSSSQLYGVLGALGGDSSFLEKSKWKTASGKTELYSTDRQQFDGGQNLLASHYSKKAIEQASVELTCFKPVGLPGDRLDLSGCPASGVEDGSYLISGCEVLVASALPRLTLTAVRP